MEYHKTITLKDGRACTLRNGTAEDGQALLNIFNVTHAQTDFLLTYPEEHSYTAEDEAELLRRKTDSADEIELLAFVDGANSLRLLTARSLARQVLPVSVERKRSVIVRSLASVWIRHTGASASDGH